MEGQAWEKGRYRKKRYRSSSTAVHAESIRIVVISVFDEITW